MTWITRLALQATDHGLLKSPDGAKGRLLSDEQPRAKVRNWPPREYFKTLFPLIALGQICISEGIFQ